MGVATKLDMQISDYLSKLNPGQKRVVLTLVKSFAEQQPVNELWEDKDFVAEMDRRFKELETGKVKGLSFEELAKRARQAYINRKRKK